jgi:hypothetical protein
MRLLKDGRTRDAYDTWLAVSADPALLRDGIYDGDFTAASNVPPFGWRMFSGVGFRGETPADGGSASPGLSADYDGFSEAVLAEQLVMLPAGRHRLSGELRAAPGEVRLAWRLSCASSEQELLKWTPSQVTGSAWSDFSADFTVPAQSCEGQWFRLTGEAGERRIPTQAWFRSLRFSAGR